jgi:hypothetical protein
MVLYAYVDIALFGVAVYFSRPTLRRLLGAFAGAAVFLLLFDKLVWAAHSSGWWDNALTNMPPMPVFLPVLGLPCWGTMLALISWRVTRRFGWRGQLTFLGIMSIGGPIRDRIGAAAMGLIVFAPGMIPFIGHAMIWALSVVAMQAVMGVVAGAARSDRLTRSGRYRARMSNF